MIELSHAVPNPRAVMVHTDYASSAHRTMVNSSFLHNITLKTVWSFVQGLDLLKADLTFLLILSPLFFLLWLSPSVSFEFLDLFPIINILYYCRLILSDSWVNLVSMWLLENNWRIESTQSLQKWEWGGRTWWNSAYIDD